MSCPKKNQNENKQLSEAFSNIKKNQKLQKKLSCLSKNNTVAERGERRKGGMQGNKEEEWSRGEGVLFYFPPEEGDSEF